MQPAIPILGLLLMTTLTSAQSPLRIACVGDSITFGDQIANRARDAYPAVLERLSGSRFAVGNFGVNGATALPIPFRAWMDTPAARDALAFAPDAVVVMLGINDLAFPERYGDFPAALESIVRRFQALPSAPRLFVCTLTPIAPADRQEHANRLIRETMNPAIRAVAAQTGARVVDVSAVFPNRLDLLPDGLHPTPGGAEIVARAVLAALDASQPTAAPAIAPAPVAGPVDLSIRNEALAAKARAETWLAKQPPPPLLQDGGTLDAETERQLVAMILPFLAGHEPTSSNAYLSYALLARALDRAGEETVFMENGQPVRWREALLHQLVQRQRIDARGGGYWADPKSSVDPVESTIHALRALNLALGQPE